MARERRDSVQFNFSRLHSVYSAAVKNGEPTIAFDVNIGRGRFLFMMFFAEEDMESRDQLFIFLRNTLLLVRLKAYGSHRNGDFVVYINDRVRQQMIDELCLEHGGGQAFEFDRLLEQLNQGIPETVANQRRIDALRDARSCNELRNQVDEATKIYLWHPMRLEPGKSPREKNLRKLYIYTDGSADDISDLIRSLKRVNMTLAWSPVDRGITVRDMIRKLS